MPILILIIVITVVIIWYRRRNKHYSYSSRTDWMKVPEPTKPAYDLSGYIKKPYLFDTNSEFHFFFVLNDLLGADYCIFPQVNYSHLVETRAGNYYENRRLRSHIERKSADFIVCDKKTCVPRLVIDLDGSVHSLPDRHEKDVEIDEVLQAVNLPILRLSNEESRNIELVKTKVLAMLK